MTQYRRHAIVVILIIAAIITPTSDAFTLTLVSLPIYLLYELSIIIVKYTYKPRIESDDEEDDDDGDLPVKASADAGSDLALKKK